MIIQSLNFELTKMTTFVSEQAFHENKLKNLKNSLKHFKKNLKRFDDETLEDLLHEKHQIIEHYNFLISHIQSGIEDAKKELKKLQ